METDCEELTRDYSVTSLCSSILLMPRLFFEEYWTMYYHDLGIKTI